MAAVGRVSPGCWCPWKTRKCSMSWSLDVYPETKHPWLELCRKVPGHDYKDRGQGQVDD